MRRAAATRAATCPVLVGVALLHLVLARFQQQATPACTSTPQQQVTPACTSTPRARSRAETRPSVADGAGRGRGRGRGAPGCEDAASSVLAASARCRSLCCAAASFWRSWNLPKTRERSAVLKRPPCVLLHARRSEHPPLSSPLFGGTLVQVPGSWEEAGEEGGGCDAPGPCSSQWTALHRSHSVALSAARASCRGSFSGGVQAPFPPATQASSSPAHRLRLIALTAAIE